MDKMAEYLAAALELEVAVASSAGGFERELQAVQRARHRVLDLLGRSSVPPRWEYAHCVNELPHLDEMGAEGWRVVPGSLRDAPWALLGVWLMERPAS